jgi:regulator of ribosome biosynthesis
MDATMTDAPAPEGLDVDVGCLMVVDTRLGLEGDLRERAAAGVEALVHAVFSLPAETTDEGRMVEMPRPVFRLPREKPIPRERTMTKWETYAKEKGIEKNKKRNRLVWSEDQQDYVPRFGKDSLKSNDGVAILPHDNKLKPGDDPFAQARREKKARVKDNKKKEAANVGRADKRLKKNKISPMQALDVAPTGPSGKKFVDKNKLKDSIEVLQRSTASAGRFDAKLKNEPKKKLAGRRQKLPNPTPARSALSSEKANSQKILARVLAGK